jgi:lipoate-protein ligase B
VNTRVVELGRVSFAETWQRMRDLAARVATDPGQGEVWLLEHEPVYTAGRAAAPPEVEALGATSIERGGQVTWHGPGQLVVYPIVALPRRDLRAWLRGLEAFGVAICHAFGLPGEPSVDGTGVFVAGRKVASIGVAVRRWVNLHGIAINVDLDLAPFFRCLPCGRDPTLMTDLSRAADRTIAMAEVIAAARAALPALLEPASTRASDDAPR